MPIRILHVGAGVRGRDWLEYVRDFPGAESVACVEPDRNALELVRRGAGSGLACFAELDEALGAVEADAALISSPSFLHGEQAVRALEAGLAVLIEKPFANDVGEARRIIEAGEAAGRTVMVGENFRYVPAERTVRKLVRDGALGRISNVSFVDRRRMPIDTQGPWVRDIDHPQLREIAVHHFDSLRSFLGLRPVNVTARTWNPAGSDYANGACTEALIEFEEGAHAQYLGTLTSNKFSYRVWIEGEEGDLWTNRKLVMWRARGKKFFRPVRPVKVLRGDGAPYPREGTTSLLEGLRAAVQDGVEPETSGRENVWAIAMREAALTSVEEGRTVSVEGLAGDAS